MPAETAPTRSRTPAMASAKRIAFVDAALVATAAIGITVANLSSAQTDAASGRALFEQACVACHGAAGQGDRAPALNTGRFVHGGEDADLARAIRSGVTGTQMP